jgi:hypothetical protein
MPNTQNSFEYKALRFLNDRFEEYTIDETTFRAFLAEFPTIEFDEGIAKLRTNKYLSNKTSPDRPNGLTITPDGMKRLNRMQEHINTLDALKISEQKDKLIDLQAENLRLSNNLLEVQIPQVKRKNWHAVIGYLAGLGSMWFGWYLGHSSEKPDREPIIQVHVGTHEARIDTLLNKADTISNTDSIQK